MSTWLDAFIDGELEPARAEALREHADACEGCAKSILERQQLRTAISSGLKYRVAPAELRQSVARRESSARIKRKAPSWAWFAIAASVCFACMGVWMFMQGSAMKNNAVMRDAVSSHIRSLMATHLTDVAASDQHTVKPWFAGKVDFSPLVVDLAGEGFPLDGGRLDYVGERPVAALVYHKRAHVINLFTCPASQNAGQSLRTLDERGYRAVFWSDGQMQYCAVSDVSTADMNAFVAAIRQQK